MKYLFFLILFILVISIVVFKNITEIRSFNHRKNRQQQFKKDINKKVNYLFIGDSHIELCDLKTYFPELNNAYNHGISAERTDGLLKRLKQELKLNPKHIIIQIGINDLLQSTKNYTKVVSNYKTILNTINNLFKGKVEVYIVSIFPVGKTKNVNNRVIDNVNKELQKMATNFNYYFLDVYSSLLDDNKMLNTSYTYDDLHLNTKGYQKFAQILNNKLLNQ